MSDFDVNWQRMIGGEEFLAFDPEFRRRKQLVRDRVAQFNRAPSRGHLKRLLELFKYASEQCHIESGIHIDLGCQISIGKHTYINANCVLLDGAELVLEDNVLVGPGVQLLTVTHPKDAERRKQGWMIAKPIHIKAGAWIGGGAIILPGVTVGKNAVVGAGSIVTRDVPDHSTVAGNPARIKGS
jgi:maltose O-acetyltransferase